MSVQSKATSHGRFYGLDGLRGIAAIIILIFHFNPLQPTFVQDAYVLVDFFFALSGFVIGMSYERKFREGMSFVHFFKMRIIRLYPIYLAGMLLGSVKALGAIILNDPQALTHFEFFTAFVFGIFMLPTPLDLFGLFPLNGPAWSLFFEMVINILFGAVLVRVSTGKLVGILFIAGAVLCASVLEHGNLNVGWEWASIDGGFARVTYAFLSGMLIARLRKGKPVSVGYIPLALAGVLVGLSLVVLPEDIRAIPDILMALFIAPFILYLGALQEVPRRFLPVCAYLGNISYPLYAIHAPMIFIVAFAARKVGLPEVLLLPVCLATTMVTATILLEFYDTPLRKFLTRKTMAQPQASLTSPLNAKVADKQEQAA